MRAFYASSISSHRSRTPEGYLVCTNVPVARTGYQTYRESEVILGGDPDKLIEVYRPAEEVFHPAAVASFEGKSVVSPHPPIFLTAENDAAFSRGHAQNVRRGPDLPNGEQALIADIVVKDVQLATQIDNGSIAETSAGYSCDYVKLPNGNYAQINIRGNHIAVVPSGRCNVCKIMDACSCNSKEVVVAEPTTPVLDADVISTQMSGWEKLFIRLGWKAPSQVTTDAESETLATQKKAAEEANRLKERTLDAEEKAKKDKEEKDAAEAIKKVAEDAAVVGVSKAMDAFFAKFAPIMEKLTTAMDKKAKDKDSDEEEEEYKESEDADLIPVETMSGDEVPKNPIPGADAAIASLRALRPFVAKSQDKEVRDAYNSAMKTLKRGIAGTTTDGYRRVVEAAERAQDADNKDKTTVEDRGQSFCEAARQFHRKNPNQVKLELIAKEA